MKTNNYRIVTKTPFDKFKSQPRDIFHIMKIFLNILNQYNALDLFDKGEFIQTRNPFTNENLVKQYVVQINIPHTIIELKKLDKGSIDTEMFMATLKNIKEAYYNERI